MKILTVCEQGLNRSVTAKYLLQNEHEVIAAGTANLSDATLKMLCEWADRIILLDATLLDNTLRPYLDKLTVWNVGPDHYEHHYNRELVARLRLMIRASEAALLFGTPGRSPTTAPRWR